MLGVIAVVIIVTVLLSISWNVGLVVNYGAAMTLFNTCLQSVRQQLHDFVAGAGCLG